MAVAGCCDDRESSGRPSVYVPPPYDNINLFREGEAVKTRWLKMERTFERGNKLRKG